MGLSVEGTNRNHAIIRHLVFNNILTFGNIVTRENDDVALLNYTEQRTPDSFHNSIEKISLVRFGEVINILYRSLAICAVCAILAIGDCEGFCRAIGKSYSVGVYKTACSGLCDR